ncbi:hypothetical protein K661_00702 [Piscirickettsia salmonis LF-89 = ATCC VR-1361]|nr:hypothetical protein K661_00702 [Piscirickettsia salmonis LF-89 = ATCC VR-1361]
MTFINNIIFINILKGLRWFSKIIKVIKSREKSISVDK